MTAPAPRVVDAVVIGTGQAGPGLATALAARGRRVALVERAALGGTCVNTGCTPTKALRKSARVAHVARRAAEFGVHVGEVSVDFAAAMQRAQDIADASRTGLGAWIGGADGVELLRGHGRLAGRDGDAFVVTVHEPEASADASPLAVLHAPRVYLNTGTRPAMPPISGLADVGALDSGALLALRECPDHLLVLGGSYIGLEFAQIMRRLGSEVTVLEGAPALAAREDPDVSQRLAALLEGEGVNVQVGVQVQQAMRNAAGRVSLAFRRGQDAPIDTVTGSHLLVATGRRPNTDDLGLDTVGVARDARGFVPVDGTLATNVAGVWALGDINGRGAFTHTSWQDHEIVLANLDGQPRSVTDRVPTYAMYTDPPLGRVGLSLAEARDQAAHGRRFLHVVHEMAKVSRAKEESETHGVIHLVVDAETERFAGATILGWGGDEVIQVISAQMAADAPYTVLRDALPVHPTVAEYLPTLLRRLAPLESKQ